MTTARAIGLNLMMTRWLELLPVTAEHASTTGMESF